MIRALRMTLSSPILALLSLPSNCYFQYITSSVQNCQPISVCINTVLSIDLHRSHSRLRDVCLLLVTFHIYIYEPKYPHVVKLDNMFYCFRKTRRYAYHHWKFVIPFIGHYMICTRSFLCVLIINLRLTEITCKNPACVHSQ
jgi:hypothetical protein